MWVGVCAGLVGCGCGWHSQTHFKLNLSQIHGILKAHKVVPDNNLPGPP